MLSIGEWVIKTSSEMEPSLSRCYSEQVLLFFISILNKNEINNLTKLKHCKKQHYTPRMLEPSATAHMTAPTSSSSSSSSSTTVGSMPVGV